MARTACLDLRLDTSPLGIYNGAPSHGKYILSLRISKLRVLAKETAQLPTARAARIDREGKGEVYPTQGPACVVHEPPLHRRAGRLGAVVVRSEALRRLGHMR